MDGSITRRGQPCWYKQVSAECTAHLWRPRRKWAASELTLRMPVPFPCLPPTPQEDVGLVAINDSFLIQASVFKLLKRHFRSKAYYVDLLELMNEVGRGLRETLGAPVCLNA